MRRVVEASILLSGRGHQLTAFGARCELLHLTRSIRTGVMLSARFFPPFDPSLNISK